MPLAQSKNQVGLGHAIINRRAKEARQKASSEFHTTDVNSYGSVSNLRSVTHEGDLEEFLNTAQLADADFTAERRNVTVITAPHKDRTRHNPYLLTGQEEQEVLKKHSQNKERLRVPRRPSWNVNTTRAQLERAEKDAFLEWRRGLAQLQEGIGLVLTPFERNIEVWRQLWRVIERSHLVVQIVDARNPLRFRCEDLEKYVTSLIVDDTQGQEYIPEGSPEKGPRRNLLLINKADLLDDKQRRYWADYFDAQGIRYAFFSAADAAAIQAARAEAEKKAALERDHGDQDKEDDEEEEEKEEEKDGSNDNESELHGEDNDAQVDQMAKATEEVELSAQQKESQQHEQEQGSAAQTSTSSITKANPLTAPNSNDPTRVLNVLELEELFMASAPPLEDFATDGNPVPSKLVVGLVGYPNVGKSSTINALLGEKKVSVSATPGKTKHFQTIHLSPSTVLCDCPGLVFAQFATTTAELVCDGVLPIDQMREYTAPAELVAKRIPKDIIEATYGIRIDTLTEEEGGNGTPTGLEILTAYAVARGYTRQGQGNPDESRSVRYVLKDYVNAKLLFGHPPPGIDADEYNAGQRDLARKALAGKRFNPNAQQDDDDDETGFDNTAAHNQRQFYRPKQGVKSLALDSAFFDSIQTSRPTIVGRTGLTGASLRGRVANDGTIVSSSSSSPSTASSADLRSNAKTNGKKHNKGHKRMKQRSGAGFD